MQTKRLPGMKDDDWLAVALALEGAAERIRGVIDQDASWNKTVRIRAMFDAENAVDFLVAAVSYGKPKGWSASGNPIY